MDDLKISLASRVADLPPDERRAILSSLSSEELAALQYVWSFWARPDQLPPAGDWFVWLLLGGRGSGKTRTAAEWVRGEIESGRRKEMAIVGPTANALRRVQIEGPSGMLAISPPEFRPTYEPSTGKLLYPNGALCHLCSAEEPERLRGLNLDGAWCDEIVTWGKCEYAWDVLSMAIRVDGPLGDAPRIVCSTTPKPIPLIRSLAKSELTVVTRSRTQDNAANLSRTALAQLMEKYGGTTLGRQELDGELLDDGSGTLWTREMLDALRVEPSPDRIFRRIVIAIDPAGSSHERSDETGIIVCAYGTDNKGYILEDLSGRYSPGGWARQAVRAYKHWNADKIVAENNFGGEMVTATIHSEDSTVPVKVVHASRGKLVRAEPIMALYEQEKVHHVGAFPTLEDQMVEWVPGSGNSPDRMDALVWGLTELMVESQPAPARWVSSKRFSLAR